MPRIGAPDLPAWQLAWQVLYNFAIATGIVLALRLLLGQRNPFDSLQDFSRYLLTAVIAPVLLTIFAPSVTLPLLAGDRELAIAHWQAQSMASATVDTDLGLMGLSGACCPNPVGCTSARPSNTSRPC